MKQELEFMDQNLKNRKLRADAEEKPLKYAQKVEKPPQRPPTPRIPSPQEEDDEFEQAAILLQKLIRGRVAQNNMYYGKERRLNLINELRTRRTMHDATQIADAKSLSMDQLSVEGAVDRKLADIEKTMALFNIKGGAANMDITKPEVKSNIFIFLGIAKR